MKPSADVPADRPITVLIVAHGHPDEAAGGGEAAAYALHRLIDATEGMRSVFLARTDDPFGSHAGTAFRGTGRDNEILFHSNTSDRFLFTQDNDRRVWKDFREVLEAVRPDIVHFHHYLHLGLELIGEARRRLPDAQLVLTLHEYQAICHNSGLMVTPRGALCTRATAERCHGCFPQRSPQDFMLRERFLKASLAPIDRFVSPSHFLADRYIDWGIEADRMHVMPNVLAPVDVWRQEAATAGTSDLARSQLDDHDDGPDRNGIRLAFFGRIDHMKGVDLLFDAWHLLDPALRSRVEIDVYGTGMERLPWLRRRRLRRHVARSNDRLRLRGPYSPGDMPALLERTDWMIVPSRWWENAPVVMQEAKRSGVPIVCADIGGMAEHVRDGVDGLHFRAGDARSLAAVLSRLSRDAGLHRRMAAESARDLDTALIAERQLRFHRELVGGAADARRVIRLERRA